MIFNTIIENQSLEIKFSDSFNQFSIKQINLFKNLIKDFDEPRILKERNKIIN